MNELERGTIYNSLLLYAPDGTLALHHRKLVPTNHERLVWGQGDGRGLDGRRRRRGRAGGLICWENLMPLARFALYERGVEIYLAPTADDSEDWQDSLRHIARESRAYVLSCCVLPARVELPDDVPLAAGDDLLGRGGSAILAPDGSYLAGPLWDEEGILYADLDPARLYEARQRFDPAGHYHRPDVLSLTVTPQQCELGVVVGAGVFGASLARALVLRGWEVTLVEQYTPGTVRSASGGDTRLLRAAHGDVEWYTASALRARTQWLELEEETGDAHLEGVGLAWFAHAPTGSRRERAVLERLGIRTSGWRRTTRAALPLARRRGSARRAVRA